VAVVLLVPVVVVIGAALVGAQWSATSDRALQVLRIHDVGTAHTPLVGVYSRFGWSHPGPMQLWLLAPFFRVSGDVGVLAGTTVINLVSLGIALWIAHRLGGARLLVLVACAEALLIHTLTPAWLMDVWNPWAAFFPFFVFVLSVAATMMRDWVAVPVLVVAGTFAVQTHVGYALPVMGIGLLAVGVLGVQALLRRRQSVSSGRTSESVGRRAGAVPIVVAIVLGVLLWLPPVVQQVTSGDGNISALIDYVRDPGQASLGWAAGVGVMGRQLAPNGPWLGGSELSALGFLATSGAWPALLLLLAVAVLAGIAWLRGERAPAALATVVLVGVALGTVATANITGAPASYLVRWWWALAALAFVSIAWSVLVLVAPAFHRVGRPVYVVGCVAVGALALFAVLDTLPVRLPNAEQSPSTRRISAELARRLDRRLTYTFTAVDGVHLGEVPTGVMVALMLDGRRVYALPKLALRVGDWRVRPPSRTDRTLIMVNADDEDRGWTPPPGARVVASDDPLSPAERRRARESARRIRQALGASAPAGPIVPATPFGRTLLVEQGARRADVERLARAQARGDAFTVYLVPPPGT